MLTPRSTGLSDHPTLRRSSIGLIFCSMDATDAGSFGPYVKPRMPYSRADRLVMCPSPSQKPKKYPTSASSTIQRGKLLVKSALVGACNFTGFGGKTIDL